MYKINGGCYSSYLPLSLRLIGPLLTITFSHLFVGQGSKSREERKVAQSEVIQ